MARHASARSPGATPVALAPRRPAGVRLGFGALIILLLAGLVAAVGISLLGASGTVRVLPEPTAAASGADGAIVYVHVLGEVENPGVYQLRDGDRVVDAIAVAGGFTPEADPQAVNLARFLSDGEQILVPVLGAAPTAGPLPADGRVNLNTATREQLETLPRVGPAMAEHIIAWREKNGSFRSVEDLLGVTGIGDKTVEALRELVTV